jgi:anti-sigma B factor antagonist
MMAAENTIAELTDEQIESLELKFQKVSSVPGGVFVSMKGYIDTYNVSHFERQVDKAIQAGYSRLIFDFAGVTYPDGLQKGLRGVSTARVFQLLQY